MNKKSIIFLFGFFVIIISGGIFLLTFFNIKSLQTNGLRLALNVLNNNPKDIKQDLTTWQKQCQTFDRQLKIIKPFITILPIKYQNKFADILQYWPMIISINPHLDSLLAVNSRKTYYLLLQNNYELRPTGGFIGSYAKLYFDNGILKDLKVEDIYVPDGQIVGHVDPPKPIQTAFKQGWWRLRDSNWDPDFPTSSQKIQWFMEKGKEEKADGMIAINFLVIKQIVDLIGPIYLPDYQITIDGNNLYQYIQNETETDFFPGSTQKKDILTALSKQVIWEFKKIDQLKTIKLLSLLKKNLTEKQILFSFNDPALQKIVQLYNWGGSLQRNLGDDEKTITDYLYIVETNLGSNKANCCVDRKIKQSVSEQDSELLNELTIDYINNSHSETVKPPLFWGGNYLNYLRIILPLESKVQTVLVNNQLISSKIDHKSYADKNLQEIGFFVDLPAAQEKQVTVIYKKPIGLMIDRYYLEIQKQPGIAAIPFQLTVDSENGIQTVNDKITEDRMIKFDF